MQLPIKAVHAEQHLSCTQGRSTLNFRKVHHLKLLNATVTDYSCQSYVSETPLFVKLYLRFCEF